VVQPRFDVVPIQRAGEEHRVRAEPGEPHVARWLHVDAVERGGEVVSAMPGPDLAERLREDHRRLPGRAEHGHRVADLLDLCEPDPAATHAREEAEHAVVVGRAVQCIDHVANRRLTAVDRLRDRVLRDVLGEVLLEVQLQDQP
jgi:hypothetical protein